MSWTWRNIGRVCTLRAACMGPSTLTTGDGGGKRGVGGRQHGLRGRAAAPAHRHDGQAVGLLGAAQPALPDRVCGEAGAAPWLHGRAAHILPRPGARRQRGLAPCRVPRPQRAGLLFPGSRRRPAAGASGRRVLRPQGAGAGAAMAYLARCTWFEGRASGCRIPRSQGGGARAAPWSHWRAACVSKRDTQQRQALALLSLAPAGHGVGCGKGLRYGMARRRPGACKQARAWRCIAVGAQGVARAGVKLRQPHSAAGAVSERALVCDKG